MIPPAAGMEIDVGFGVGSQRVDRVSVNQHGVAIAILNSMVHMGTLLQSAEWWRSKAAEMRRHWFEEGEDWLSANDPVTERITPEQLAKAITYLDSGVPDLASLVPGISPGQGPAPEGD